MPFFCCVALLSVILGGYLHASSVQRVRCEDWRAVIHRLGPRPVQVDGTVHSNLRRGVTRFEQERLSFFLNDVRLGDQAVRGKILVQFFGAAPGVRYGSHVRVKGVLENPSGRRNPAGFDHRQYLWSRDAYAILRAEQLTDLGPDTSRFGGWIYRLKNHLASRLAAVLKESEAAFAGALLLGDRAHLDPSFKQALVRTGTMHLFAISGLHVGLVSFFIYQLLQLLRVRECPKVLMMMLFLWVYCLLAGANPPVLRATIMTSVFLLGRLLYRSSSVLNTLGLAGFLILFWNPLQLEAAGFQLSFLAVAGMVILTPRFFSSRDFKKLRSSRFSDRAFFHLKSLAVVSIIAWAVTIPLAIHVFHRVHLLSPLLTLALLPFVFVLCILFLCFSVFSFLPSGILSVFSGPISLCVQAMSGIVTAFDAVSHLGMASRAWLLGTWCLAYGGIFLISRSREIKHHGIRLALILLCVYNCIFLDQAVAQAGEPSYRITFFDVGQGDSIFFEFPGGGNLLVDTGSPSSDGKSEYVITPYLNSRGVEKIDAVVISHPQYDHSGALLPLLRDFEIGLLLGNGRGSEARFYRRILKAAEERKVPVAAVRSGDRLAGYGKAVVEVLHPGRTHLDAGVNDDSVVLRITADGLETVLAGDLEEKGIESLLSHHAFQKTGILKTPHHGARLGPQGLRWLRQLRPDLAVIQVGRRNRYNHPHEETLEALEGLSGKFFRTDRDGAIQVALDAGGGVTARPMIAAGEE